MRAVLCAWIVALGRLYGRASNRAPSRSKTSLDLASGPDADAAHVLRVGGLSGIAFDPLGRAAGRERRPRPEPRVLTFRLHETSVPRSSQPG